jgi:hypothetical protein
MHPLLDPHTLRRSPRKVAQINRDKGIADRLAFQTVFQEIVRNTSTSSPEWLPGAITVVSTAYTEEVRTAFTFHESELHPFAENRRLFGDH